MKLSSHQRYHLVRDQVKCSMWPVKMATGHFPTESHNLAWNGHVNINGMTTVTLQTKYNPTLPSGYPKVAYPLEMSSGCGIYSDAVSHLLAAQPPTAKRPADHVDVVYRDVIAGSRESHGHHYDAPFIYQILKSLMPQNNTFFIATASVVKDALHTTPLIMRDWENNGTICNSTCAARCCLLMVGSHQLEPFFGYQRAEMRPMSPKV